MKKDNLKRIKVLGLSLLSLVFYFLLDHSSKVNSIINALQKSNSSKGFGFYLFKWLLLIFGIMALIVIICDLLKKR
jgi:hypothetical protein